MPAGKDLVLTAALTSRLGRLDRGVAYVGQFGTLSAKLPTAMLAGLNGGSLPTAKLVAALAGPPLPSLATAILAGLNGGSLPTAKLAATLAGPPLPSLATAILAGLNGGSLPTAKLAATLAGPPLPSLATAILAGLNGGSLPTAKLVAALAGPPLPSLATAMLAGLNGGSLPTAKLAATLAGPPLPSLATAMLAGLNGGSLPTAKLVAALAGPPLPSLATAMLAGLNGGSLPTAKLAATLAGPPLPSLTTAMLAGLNGPSLPRVRSFWPAGLNGQLIADLYEPECGRLTEPGFELRGYAEAGRTLKLHEDSGGDVSLEYTLCLLNPAFAAQYRGWIQRSEERGPDWLRQAAASIRTLLLGLLHAAAPDNVVLLWVTKPDAQLDGHGRPTRRTKIAWLCSSIQDEGYRKFVRMELDSGLAVLELLNQAVHKNQFPELEESFTSVSARVRFAIRHIARLWERRRST